MTGKIDPPEVQKLDTSLEWGDMILDSATKEQVAQLVKQKAFRALFYGSPGTGKTLAASLIGKSSGRDVYRVDLKKMVSKHIGETEENLSRIFDNLKQKGCILLFDEANGLLGKHTIETLTNKRAASNSNPLSYLHQRMESYEVSLIFASALPVNTGDAFTQFFSTTVHFAIPGAEQRIQLWHKAFAGEIKLSAEININEIAENCELTGGDIINILRFCAFKTQTSAGFITMEILTEEINRERAKKGK